MNKLSFLVFIFALLSQTAFSETINFTGSLDVIDVDSGGAIYANTPLGTTFSGFIDDATSNGQITDGVTATNFGCCIAAGKLSITNNSVLDSDAANTLNTLAGANVFSAGSVVDLVDIEGDQALTGGGRIEVGLSYVLNSTAFTNENLSNYPFDPANVLVSLFFIVEENAVNEIYNVLGAINTSPFFTTTPVATASTSNLYSYNVDATDLDGDTLTYSLNVAPAGMTIDTASGLIQWTPSTPQIGSNSVTVRVTDSNSATDTQSFNISVTDSNTTPTINSTPTTTAIPGNLYSYDVDATDPDVGDTLTYSLDVAPAGMTINTATGLIQWTPANSQLGGNNITVRVTDNNSASVTQSYTITVINNAPTITSTPAVIATTGNLYSYDVDATDPDAGHTQTFSLDVAPAGMTINTATGLIQWTPANSQLGGNSVTVRVTDNIGASDTQSFTLNVTTPGNNAPSITSGPVTTAIPGVLYSYDVNATDPDGDTLTYTLDVAPAGMTINTATGQIQWTPANSQLGGNNITVRVTDGNTNSDTQSFTVTVINNAPTITSTPAVTATTGNLYSYDVDATDPDAGQTLTFSLDIAPAGMTINTATGLIQWTPAISQLGGNNITVRVTDSIGATDTQSFTLNVTTPGNNAPAVISTPITIAAIGVLYSYDVNAMDADGDTLTYSLDLAPAGFTINTATGLTQWTPAITQIGSSSVTVRVTDGNGGSDTQSFIINVMIPGNNAPAITSTAITTATTGNLYNYDVNATDSDGDTLTFNLDEAPAGFTITTATGLTQWTPAATQTGPHKVTVRVSDGNGGFDTQSYTITVSGPNTTPIAEAGADQSVQVGNTVTLDGSSSSDVDGDTLTFTWSLTVPAGSTANLSDPSIVMPTFFADISGSYIVQLIVNDGQSDSLSDTVTITVTDSSGGGGSISWLLIFLTFLLYINHQAVKQLEKFNMN